MASESVTVRQMFELHYQGFRRAESAFKAIARLLADNAANGDLSAVDEAEALAALAAVAARSLADDADEHRRAAASHEATP